MELRGRRENKPIRAAGMLERATVFRSSTAKTMSLVLTGLAAANSAKKRRILRSRQSRGRSPYHSRERYQPVTETSEVLGTRSKPMRRVRLEPVSGQDSEETVLVTRIVDRVLDDIFMVDEVLSAKRKRNVWQIYSVRPRALDASAEAAIHSIRIAAHAVW